MCMRVQMPTPGQAGGPRSLRLDYPLNCEGQRVSRVPKFSPKEVVMSIESAKAFVEKMRRNAAFKKQILAAESAATRKELIKSAGFDFERMHLDSLVSDLTPEERDALMLL